jgi:hypothetical protein
MQSLAASGLQVRKRKKSWVVVVMVVIGEGGWVGRLISLVTGRGLNSPTHSATHMRSLAWLFWKTFPRCWKMSGVKR